MKTTELIKHILFMRSTGKPPFVSTFTDFSRGIAEGSAGLACMLLLITGCAKVGAPTGGQKDLNPPVFLEGVPENRSVNFSGKELEITFDEYIQLKDQNRELMISPPLKKRPVIRIRDKSIRVTLNNELLPQTTYTVNFGNAISDNNEGNVLPDFEFVFSTGNTLDSLSVTGNVLNAFDHKPAKEELFVMLYDNLSDSAPLLEIPRYIGKASKAGLFSINNLRADTFRLIALMDANNDRIYNPGGESIGFLDSLLIINTSNVQPVTFIKDTVRIIHPAAKGGRSGKQNQELKADTTIAPGKRLNAVNVSLLFFQEEEKKVFLSTKKRDKPEKLTFIFTRPPHDPVKIAPLNFSPAANWYLKEESVRGDTLTCWITDTLITQQDTLKMAMTYLTADSTDKLVERSDTVALRVQKTEERSGSARRGRSQDEVKKKESLALTSTLTSRKTQELNAPIVIVAGRPLDSIDPVNIELYRQEDSLYVKQTFTISRDSLNIKSFKISSEWKEDLPYTLLLKPGAVHDIYGLTHDSLEIKFATRRADYYGRIIVTLGSEHFPLLLQLVDEKEKLFQQKEVKESGAVVFEYLAPNKYVLKAVYDENENSKWDTGCYLKFIQPERVYYHKMSEPVRSNWDHEITWNIAD